jgi:hypothetical protein
MPARDSKLVRTLLFILFFFLAAYGLYEGWGMLNGPVITVPGANITSHESYVLVRGRAERITELQLNGKAIAVTEEGEFAEPYLLAPGTNHLILEARDARGRQTKEELDILYVPQKAASLPADPVATSTPFDS